MIHETAIIAKDVRIGEGAEIGAFAVIERDARIGADACVESHAIIKTGARIGVGAKVGSFSVIAGLPQDLSFDPNTTTYARIGDRTVVREGSTINRATKDGASTEVGEDCFLMANTHLGHDCQIGNRVVIANNSLLGGFASVGDDAFLGGAFGVHQFCRIGQGVMCGGNSTTTVDVPPFTMFAERNRLFGLNLVGLRRRGHSNDAIKALKRCYTELYSRRSKLREAALELGKSEQFAVISECQAFLSFFAEGSRGFAQPRRLSKPGN